MGGAGGGGGGLGAVLLHTSECQHAAVIMSMTSLLTYK